MSVDSEYIASNLIALALFALVVTICEAYAKLPESLKINVMKDIIFKYGDTIFD